MSDKFLRENVDRGKVNVPVYFYEYEGTDYDLWLHWHEEVEFIYIEEGELDITVDMITYTLKKGEGMIINSGQVHTAVSLKGKKLKHYAVLFSLDFLRGNTSDYCYINYILGLESGKKRFINKLTIEKYLEKEVITKWKELLNVTKEKNIMWELKSKSLLYNIIADMYEIGGIIIEAEGVNSSYEKIERIKMVIQYIQKNYSRKIYLHELARTVNMNKQYFCRFFKKNTGYTPVEYINSYRVEKALELLNEGDKNTSEVCYDVGFDNISYFIKKFKEHCGMTPNSFRKKVENAGKNKEK